MTIRTLVLASAGSGKTERIVSDAVDRYRDNQTVLIITYTENNQHELRRRISIILGAVPNKIQIKGWFTFLLDDLIRPYQQVFFEKRVEGVNFDSSNPHRVRGRNFTIPGRQESLAGRPNSKHYLTSGKNRAHTAFISKLACKISEADGACLSRQVGRKSIKEGFAFERLKGIYDAIFFDEVQDLTGWDFAILDKLSVITELDLVCVGDFRQTIYLTHHDSKKPNTNAEKLNAFQALKFVPENQFISHRCLQSICNFSNTIHAALKLPPTKSQVTDVPDEYSSHTGVFTVSENHFLAYFEKYKPIILRNKRNVAAGLCEGKIAYNFGEAKGLGFNRTLIIPTPRQTKFLNGQNDAFDDLKTEQEINRFYVAVTRAKYSVAILSNEKSKQLGVKTWEKP